MLASTRCLGTCCAFLAQSKLAVPIRLANSRAFAALAKAAKPRSLVMRGEIVEQSISTNTTAHPPTESQPIGRALHAKRALVQHMRVNHRRLKADVAEQLLNGAKYRNRSLRFLPAPPCNHFIQPVRYGYYPPATTA